MYYRLNSDEENFKNYIMMGYSQDYANTFDGRSQEQTYQPQTFKLTQTSEKKYPVADIFTGYLPVCSERVKNIFEQFCSKNEVEFLPCFLDGTNENFYIFNVLGQEDCVDYEKSNYQKFSNSNKIMFFNHIEFKQNINRHLFRLKDLPYCNYFVSQSLKEKLEEAGVQGFLFEDKLFR